MMPDDNSNSSTQNSSALYKDLRKEYESLFTLKEDSGLEISPIFNVLPPKKDYPDYYAVIKNPVSFNTLKKRIPHYTDAQQFMNDVVQIPWNAKTYNTRDSGIYKYALVLEKYIKDTIYPNLKEKYPQLVYPDLGPLPDEPGYEEFQQKLREKAEEVARANAARAESSSSMNSTEAARRLRKTRTSVKRESEPGTDTNNDEDYEATDMDIDNPKDADFPDLIRKPLININPYTRKPLRDNRSTTPSHSGTPQPLGPRHRQVSRTQVKRGRPPIIDLPYIQRMKNVMKVLKKEVLDSGIGLTDLFERLPDRHRDANYYIMIANPISLQDINKKVKTRRYKTFQEFQNDFNLMLTNFRISHRGDPESIKISNILEKTFTSLARFELSKPDRSFIPEGELRYPLDEVIVNNISYHVGDWALLRNQNDPQKPIVGQIFRLWKTPDGKQWLNACWYYRPEQTVHRVDRLFYKNEVMKTGQYRDHLVSNLVGKCYVIHFTRYQRGNPDMKLEGPLFVCEFRYNESDKIFNKIRTWKACLPEEIRDLDEGTIPVNGRKFFKYPSPIRHLLPANATPHDRVPEPTMGSPDAPPLVGAVYMRPKMQRDDLGEYATSDDCPRYIIRPNDSPEEGQVDIETGTITTNTPTANALPKTGYSSSKLSSLRYNRSSMSLENQNAIGQQQIPLSRVGSPGAGGALTVQGLKQHQLQRLQQQQHQYQQQKRSQASRYNIPTIIDDLTSQASRGNLGNIMIDAASSFVLPISITKNVDVLQRTDLHSQAKRSGREEMFPWKKTKGEILWFRGPSVIVNERIINSGDPHLSLPLNRWFTTNKKRKLEYEEVEETMEDVTGKDKDDDGLEPDVENEKESLPGPFVLGLRPSAKFTAHRLSMLRPPSSSS